MNNTGIRQEIIDRVLARRGKLHLFDRFVPEETALVVIDMQPTFVAPGAPAKVPAARGIVATIQRLANAMRPLGVLIFWFTHANSQTEKGSDWNGFFDYFVADDLREKTLVSLKPGNPDTLLWHTFETDADDIFLFKNRYSALIQGSSDLQKVLNDRGIQNLLVTGTKTNVCCEATARDAMRSFVSSFPRRVRTDSSARSRSSCAEMKEWIFIASEVSKPYYFIGGTL